MSLAKGQNLIFFWSAATNFFPLIGAFVADSYLGRFLTIALGSVISLLVISFVFYLYFIRVPGLRQGLISSLGNLSFFFF